MSNNIQLPNSVAKDLIQKIKEVKDKVSDINDLEDVGNGFLISTDWYQSLSENEQKSVLKNGALQLIKEFSENSKVNSQNSYQKMVQDNEKELQEEQENILQPKIKRKKSKRKFIKKYWTYLFDLIPSIIFTNLIVVQLYSSDYDYEIEYIVLIFWVIFFSITVIEWYRRYVEKEANPFYYRFIYIGFILISFVLGVWYINQLGR